MLKVKGGSIVRPHLRVSATRSFAIAKLVPRFCKVQDVHLHDLGEELVVDGNAIHDDPSVPGKQTDSVARRVCEAHFEAALLGKVDEVHLMGSQADGGSVIKPILEGG